MAKTKVGWSDDDKAAAYVIWFSNDKNMKKTARETGLPESTLRYWIKDWNENGAPDAVLDKVPTQAYEFIYHANEVRDSAIRKLAELIPQAEVKQLSAVATVVGILDDKIRLANGLATKRIENTVALPSKDDMKELMSSFVGGLVGSAEERAAEVIDAEVVVEQPKLIGLPNRKDD